ncbi:MAG: hypothetical protein AMXMBFR34_09800 [Myxococcaceae bacterium]
MSNSAPATTENRFAFPAAIEGVVKGLGPLVTPRTRQKLRAVGLDLDRIPPAIPAERMPVYFETIAEDIWPTETRDERVRLLGLHFIRGWQSTLLGRATSSFMKLVGPHRTLSRLDRAFRTSDNYTRSAYELVSEKDVLLHISDVDGLPTYWIGLLSGGLEFLGLQGGTVVLEAYPKPGATFRLRW